MTQDQKRLGACMRVSMKDQPRAWGSLLCSLTAPSSLSVPLSVNRRPRVQGGGASVKRAGMDPGKALSCWQNCRLGSTGVLPILL